MEFVLGGLAAVGAGFFSNPLEVVKTRIQLQGELRARGQYVVLYRNFAHAFVAIAKVDGPLALQKGLVPALWYQITMNGIRLGAYQTITNAGFTRNAHGDVSLWRCALAGAVSGCIGAFVGNPMYLVKTHLQAQAQAEIAVGHQHGHKSMSSALKGIYAKHGVVGLWRGVTAAVPRVMVGSSTQLATFSTCLQFIDELKAFPSGSWENLLAASMISGVVVTLFMTPFDVVSTRLFNQGVDSSGKGLFYSSYLDCWTKMLRKEGVFSFYKGYTASLLRLGPHTVLSFVFWQKLRAGYFQIRAAPINNN